MLLTLMVMLLSREWFVLLTVMLLSREWIVLLRVMLLTLMVMLLSRECSVLCFASRCLFTYLFVCFSYSSLDHCLVCS